MRFASSGGDRFNDSKAKCQEIRYKLLCRSSPQVDLRVRQLMRRRAWLERVSNSLALTRIRRHFGTFPQTHQVEFYARHSVAVVTRTLDGSLLLCVSLSVTLGN